MIWTSSNRERAGIRQALELIVAAELLSPSKELWIVSPWISDIPLIDDSHGLFRYVNPDGYETVTFTKLIDYLLQRGTRVAVVTHVDSTQETDRFLSRLEELERRASGGLRVLRHPTLHAKGLLGDTYALTGSMNFTWNGVTTNQELVYFDREHRSILQLRDRFAAEFGEWQGVE